MKLSGNQKNSDFPPIQPLEPRRLMSLTAPFDISSDLSAGASGGQSIVHSFGYETKSAALTSAFPAPDEEASAFETQLIASIARGIALRSAIATLAIPGSSQKSLSELYSQLPTSTAVAIDQAGESVLHSPAAAVTAVVVTTAIAQSEIAKVRRRHPDLFCSRVIKINTKMLPDA